VSDTPSTATALGVDFVDILVPANQQVPIRFTFFWNNSGNWEQHDYAIAVE